jgi:hypothetical protein
MSKREQYRQARPHRWYASNTWSWGSVFKAPKMTDAYAIVIIVLATAFLNYLGNVVKLFNLFAISACIGGILLVAASISPKQWMNNYYALAGIALAASAFFALAAMVHSLLGGH